MERRMAFDQLHGQAPTIDRVTKDVKSTKVKK